MNIKNMLFVLLPLMASCLAPEEAQIGVILPLSGPFAQYGNEAKDGITLALEESSQKATILYEDSKGDSKEGVNAFFRLADIVTATITGTSFVSNPVAPLSNEKEIPQISIFSSNNDYATPDDYTFRVSPRAEVESQFLSEEIKKRNQPIGIVYANNDYGKGELKAFTAHLGDLLVFSDYTLPQETDFKVQLSKAKEAKVEALILVGSSKQDGILVKQAKEMGINISFFATRSLQGADFLSSAQEAGEGVIYTYSFHPSFGKAQQFSERFAQRFGYEPTAYAAEGYTATTIVLDATAVCGRDRLCIKKNLSEKRIYNTVFGNISFDENGDVYYPFVIKTVKNGKFVKE